MYVIQDSDSRVQLSARLLLDLFPQLEGLLHHADIVGLIIGLPGDAGAAMGAATCVQRGELGSK